MNAPRWSILLPVLLLGAVLSAPARADHHLMQIEQVIGGVDGDVTAQAVQLRMRSSFQNIMANGRMRCWDAAGANPVMVHDFVTNVPNHGAGVRVLLLSAGMAAHLNGPSNADYIMTNPIPPSYLAAGSLTFEDNFGTIWWRVSWGGASYTGSGSVSATNDGQGDLTFNPPYANALPSGTAQSLLTVLAATAGGRSTAEDYTLTPGNAVLTNNANVARTVLSVAGVGDPPVAAVQLGPPSPNPSTGSLTYTLSLPRESHARVEVFTVSGRLVTTLLDRALPAGPHTFPWNGRAADGAALAAGVYHMRLTADGVQMSRKFAMIR